MRDADMLKDAALIVWRASMLLRLALDGNTDARKLAPVHFAGLDETAHTLHDAARRIRAGGDV